MTTTPPTDPDTGRELGERTLAQDEHVARVALIDYYNKEAKRTLRATQRKRDPWRQSERAAHMADVKLSVIRSLKRLGFSTEGLE